MGTGTSAWQVISGDTGGLSHFNQGTASKILSYTGLINSFRKDSAETEAFIKAREIAMGSGIIRELREGKSPEEVSRYENLEELLNGIKIFTESAETNGEPTSLEAYMATVSLLTDQDNEKSEDRDKVTLMTMHSAKGLEFKVVFVVGATDGQFVPRDDWTLEGEELEDYLARERRLLYVAMTRARDLLYVTYSRGQPSRFLASVPRETMHRL